LTAGFGRRFGIECQSDLRASHKPGRPFSAAG
jgi:hypothetical protein